MPTEHRHPRNDYCLAYERPVTLRALRVAWTDRDDRYARLPQALTEEQISAIQLSRMREVGYLPVEERAAGFGAVRGWYAPLHGQS